MLAVYGIVGGNEAGWTSGQTLGILAASAVLGAAFIVWEARVEHPLMPLRLFRLRNVTISQIVGVLWAGRDVRVVLPVRALPPAGAGVRRPREVGLASPDQPGHGASAHCSSDRLVMRFGIRPPLDVGLAWPRSAWPCCPALPWTAPSWPTYCPRCCCSARAPASRSTRCCSRPWVTWSPTSRAWPRAWWPTPAS